MACLRELLAVQLAVAVLVEGVECLPDVLPGPENAGRGR
jgi:hypothetical protein